MWDLPATGAPRMANDSPAHRPKGPFGEEAQGHFQPRSPGESEDLEGRGTHWDHTHQEGRLKPGRVCAKPAVGPASRLPELGPPAPLPEAGALNPQACGVEVGLRAGWGCTDACYLAPSPAPCMTTRASLPSKSLNPNSLIS